MRLAVINLKGGTGKTVTAVHLAAALAGQGRPLLVDAEPQGSALSWSEQAEALTFAVVGIPGRSGGARRGTSLGSHSSARLSARLRGISALTPRYFG
jgi:cellulose biosynthesis protein BcsQ